MVGVPVLFCACDSAPVPFVWVMVVGVGVSWWCVFQWCVAVVPASRRVPGVGVCVSWLVPGACSGVGWLGFGACVRDWGACVGVGVAGLVCVSWFRMLTCLGLFPVFGCCLLFVWLITLPGAVGAVLVCVVSGGRLHVWLLLVGGCLAWCAFLGSCGYWVVVLFFWCALLCASVFGEGVLGESVCWRVWLFG